MSPEPDDQDARTQRHLAVLDTLIAHGMDLANRLHQQATTTAGLAPATAGLASATAEPKPEPGPTQTEPPAAPPITPEVIALFDQISRAVRRAILVSRKLAEPLPLAPAKPDPGRIARTRTAARKRIIREVEDTIHRKAARGEADTLQAELHERVESVDLDDDIGHRPVHEIIADICRDLGFTSISEQGRFKRRTPQDLRALNDRAARRTSPAHPVRATPWPSGPDPDDDEHHAMVPPRCTKPDPRPPER